MTTATSKATTSKEAPKAAIAAAVIAEKKPTGKATLSKATKAIEFIHKATGQRPIGEMKGTHPHVPTGSMTVDTLVGGAPLPDGKGFICPGFPRQRIVEVYGAESSGKTTLVLKAIANCQRAGGVAMFLDFENALHHGYARSIGVSFDPDKLLYYTPDNLEEGLKMIYIAIKSGVDLVAVDSVSAMVPKSELEKKLDDPAKIGAQAVAMSTNLPKMVQWLKGIKTGEKTAERPVTCLVLINQIRSLISSSARGDTDNTSGGKAPKFYAGLRLKLTRIRSDYVEKVDPLTLKKKKQPYGNLVQVKVVKNKMYGNQGATGEIFIRYGFGVDEYMTAIECALPRKIITKSGSVYTLSGQSFRGKEQVRRYLIDNPKAFADLQSKISAALLAAAPEPLSGEDEIEDEDILSSMQKELGDDELFDSEEGGGESEEVVEEGG